MGSILVALSAGCPTYARSKAFFARNPGPVLTTFYVVKILFSRGHAASLLIGLDVQGEICRISLMSMAGD
jgi:hypothetical protein